jgi:hypothetical protein
LILKGAAEEELSSKGGVNHFLAREKYLIMKITH